LKTVGEAEAIAGEHRQGIPGWTHRGRWAGAQATAPDLKHIGPIDPDASTLNQFLNLFRRTTANVLVDGGKVQDKILAHCGTHCTAGPQAPDSRAGDQERDAGSLTVTFPPLLMFQLNAREDSYLF